MPRTDDVDLPPKQPETGERQPKKPRTPKPRQEAANEPRINTITNPENPEASIDTRESATSCDEGHEVLIPLAEVGEPTEVNPREHVIPQEVQEETSVDDEKSTPSEETPNKPQESGLQSIITVIVTLLKTVCAIMLTLTAKPPMKPQEMKVGPINDDEEINSSSPPPQREPNNTTAIPDHKGNQLKVSPNPDAPKHCTEHATVDSETPSPTTDPPSLDVIRLACPNNNLCVDGSILGTKCSFLIDTGASISAVKAQVWRDLPPPTKHPPQSSIHKTIRTVNGQPIPVLGEVELPFQIQSEQYPFTVLILHEMPYDAILGRDFLERYRAKIDLETHSLDLSLNSLPFSSIAANTQEDPAGEVTTHAHSSFLLPPESETVVPATVEGIQPGSTGLVHPNPDLPNRYGIIAATALVKVTADGTVPIRLLNPASQPVFLYRRTTLGTFTPTDSTIATFELGQADAAAEAARDVPTATDSDTQPWPNLENSSLDAPQTDRLRQLLLSYKDVFAFTPDQLGRTSVVKHTIDTGDNPPIRLRAYRTAPNGKAEIDKQIGEMLDTGVISPSVSPWAAPVVLVKKSDGTMRFCVDYRKLNDVTRKDSHPLPRIAESLDALGGARYFSTLDLRSGYWQIEMAADSKEKTAFITHNGLYEFNVLPFGLCNSPATFQRLMTHLMRGLEWSTCLVYIDDLIIFSRSFDDHLQHLEEVFKRLRDANVRLKPSKCHFVKPEVDYLGHLVSASGLRPNPDKIRAVQQFPTPRNVTDVRSFLGLANYYRRFIKGFAQIAAPLNNLTRKTVPFCWDDDCQTAFDRLKHALTTAPILAYPDFALPFHLYVDASQDGIGLTLGQTIDGKELAIAYAGRDLNKAERNYSATEREALAVIDGIKRFQPYLTGRKFIVHTDHTALKWLMSIQNPTGRLARWSMLIQNFDFDIVHRPGKLNGNADALSRRPYGTCSLNALDSAGVQTNRIYEYQRRDPALSDLITYLEEDILPQDRTKARQLLLSQDLFYLGEDDLLYHLDTSERRSDKGVHSQLVIPAALRYEVLVNAHDELAGGHLGIYKTYEKIRRRYYWRGLYKDCEHWIRSCADCATRKHPRNRRKAPLVPIPVEGAFDRLAVDCLGPLPTTHQGNKYIVVFTDYLTRWVEAFPVPTIDAVQVAQLITQEIIPRHGVPRTLLSDRGRNFLSTLVLEVCRLFSIRKLNTTAYHPQTDGVVERFNSTLCQTLSMFVSRNQKDWDLFIPAALFAFRTSPSETTLDSPFYLLYGREPRLPMDASLLPPTDPSSSIAEHRRRIVQQIETSQRLALENTQRAQQRMKQHYDQSARPPIFQVGDRVWVFTPKTYKGLSKKLLHNWHGPFRVVEQLGPSHYRLRTYQNRLVLSIVHANRMKPFYDPDDRPIRPPADDIFDEHYLDEADLPPDSVAPNPPPAAPPDTPPGEADPPAQPPIDNNTIFNAERLLDRRIRDGHPEYLVLWAGYPRSQATWEPPDNLFDPRLVADFEHHHGALGNQ